MKAQQQRQEAKETTQRINYVGYHRALCQRIAADSALSPAAVSLCQMLFFLWNSAEWASQFQTDTKSLLALCKIKKPETLKDALELLHESGYVDVQSRVGNKGGYSISFPEAIQKQAFNTPENGGIKTPENGVIKEVNTPENGGIEQGADKINTPENGCLNHPKTGELKKSIPPKTGDSYTSIPTVQTTVDVETETNSSVSAGAETGTGGEKKIAQSTQNETTQTPPEKAKRKKVAPKKEKVTPVPHWKPLVDEWFRFYREKHAGNEPTLDGTAAAALKAIVAKLEKRAAGKGVTWTEEAAVSRFQGFLTHAHGRKWLKENFLLHIINTQFDAIINGEQQPQQSAYQEGSNVIGARNPDIERDLTTELEQHLPKSPHASGWPD